MNTDDDIELHDLETIEQSLSTESKAAASPERSAVASGFAIASGSGFEMS